MTQRIFLFIVPALCLLPTSGARAEAPAKDKAPSFERDVQPLLQARCVKCHGGEKPKAKLDLRDKAGVLKGGESGPAVVPGQAEHSLLFDMVRSGEMPPKKNAKLTKAEVSLIKAWIDAGAPSGHGTAVAYAVPTRPVTEQDRRFWAFQPPVRPPVPQVGHADRVRTPIDAFILAKLEAQGLTLSPDADRGTLLRRAYFDLTGLPPSPDEQNAFLADTQPGAYERLIERLLASPHYGERWGRHWLDAAGYADTVGTDNDATIITPREASWQYRDYVVRALNSDKPYDRFITEQLAGDEMDDWRNAATLTPQMHEHLVATGFLRTAIDNTDAYELNRLLERYQVLHDTIDSLTSNLLGLTVHCAQCHDHKFDPIPQVDYYGLMACLKPSYNPEAWLQPQERRLADVSPKKAAAIQQSNAAIDGQAAKLQRDIAAMRRPVEQRLLEVRLARIPEALRGDVRSALATEADKRSEVQKYLAEKLGPLVKVPAAEVDKALPTADRKRVAQLTSIIAVLNGRKQKAGVIQALWEPKLDKVPPTYLLRRGNYLFPGAEVQAGFLTVLTDLKTSAVIAPASGSRGSGRRTALAHWLTRPDHPLTARVYVNRVWRHYFGEGIVATVDNFGHLGSRPTHPELLDWLATEFVRNGWSMKALHRAIVTSSVYRQASANSDPLASTSSSDMRTPQAVDPGDQLLWHMRLRRMESEVIRDAVLAAAGRLDLTIGGPPVPIDPQPDGSVVVAHKGLLSPTAAWRRSLYLLARRNYNLSLLNVFDQPVLNTNCTQRINSAVPLQSLAMLHNVFMYEQSDAFAARVAALAGPAADRRIETAFRIAYARQPTASERSASIELLQSVARRYAESKLSPAQAEMKALAQLCHMLMCGNEFLYVG
jgi:hypothetical protein